MNPFIVLIKVVAILVCLPVAPVAEDRIIAARLFRKSLQAHLPVRGRRQLLFLLTWLDRAAGRQRRLNAINLPAYEELQRRKWEQSYAYKFAAKRFLSWWSLYYGVDRLEPLVMQHCPQFYRCLCSAISLAFTLGETMGRWVLHFFS